jgi:hypothetical protein
VRHGLSGRTVHLICSIPLDLPIDEPVTWKQLTGNRRLSDALAEYNARDWDALPLGPKQLTRLFPAPLGYEEGRRALDCEEPPRSY